MNRVLFWGIGGLASATMPVYSLVMRIVVGPVPPDIQRIVASFLGLIAAVAIWLAFFPPETYRRRFVERIDGAQPT